MKKVEAIIRHFKLDDVTDALVRLHIPGLTVTDGRGSVRRREAGASDSVEFLPKSHLEIVLPDELVAPVVEAIQRVAWTGQTGDGRVIVSQVDQVIRIRTGETLDYVPARTGETIDMPLAASA